MNAVLGLKLLAIFGTVAAGSGLGVAARRGWLGAALRKFDLAGWIARATFGLFIPALLFRAIARLDLAHLPAPLLVAYFVPALIYLGVVYAIARRYTLPGQPAAAATRAVAATYGNSVQIGLPMAAAVFGAQGLGLHVALVSVHGLLILVLATTLVEIDLARHGGTATLGQTLAQTVRNTVVHPVVLPVLAGFVWNLLGLSLPGPLDEVLQVLGAVALPLCLLATGLALVTYGTQGDWRAAAVIAAAKLLVMPAVVGLAAAWVFGLSGQALAVLVLFAAAPVGANPLIFALRYRCLEGEVSVAIVLSTLAFVLTAPLAVALLGQSAP